MSRKGLSIGIFDSGFGGLTVMRAIRELLPHENILYFGDTARLPYGAKSKETILRYSLESTAFLATQGIKMLVIACNTASCAALEQIRASLSIPVIGITEQGIEEVLRFSSGAKVGILGTRATIASRLYQDQLFQKNPSLQLFPVACPLFVSLVEEGHIDHPMSHLIAHEYLASLKHHKIQGALLGCTHYPLLRATIQSALGPEVQLIDPAAACARKTQEMLKALDLINDSSQPPQYQFLVSDDPEKFRHLGPTFLNYPIQHVSLVPHKVKGEKKPQKVLRFHHFTLDVERYLLKKKKALIAVTFCEFEILRRLLLKKGRPLTRGELCDEPLVTNRSIDVHVASLRKKLGADFAGIETVRGIGYRLKQGGL